METNNQKNVLGISLSNGTRITHGNSGNIKNPLSNAPVVMHELYTGDDDNENLTFKGQFGYIEFNCECRLPRHIHMIIDETTGEYRLLPERILVLNGVGITELEGEYYVIAPGTLVDIPPGVPHTWNACPAGIVLPDGTVSDGTFTMVYNYAEKTNFFPTKETGKIFSADDYVPYSGDIEEIRFPVMDKSDVLKTASMVWDEQVYKDLSGFEGLQHHPDSI